MGSKNDYHFYRKSVSEHKRFLVIHETSSLESADTYNSIIREIVPFELKSDPAFEKNSDLIVLFKMDNLSDFKFHENKIFAIEEDPFQFKKYVLYYSDDEEGLVNELSYNDLKKIILDRDSFRAYKAKPNHPSKYSFTARLFIKVPFLEVPVEEEELKSIDVMLTETYKDQNLSDFDGYITRLTNDKTVDYDFLIEEYLNDKLETK